MKFSITLEEHIQALCKYVSKTNSNYLINYDENLNVHPIPFFGNITTAEIITVGANPSNGEFKNKRWPKEINSRELMDRLLNYFNWPINSHPWFENWKVALRHLDRSYSGGTAAHIDLSPRATFPIRSLKDKDNYNEMVEEDIEWFFELLTFCSKTKLILIAGAIPAGHINKIIKKYSYKYSGKLLFPCEPKKKEGTGFAVFQNLKIKGKTYDIFYCSSGPSYRIDSQLFIEKIEGKKDRLLNILNKSQSYE